MAELWLNGAAVFGLGLNGLTGLAFRQLCATAISLATLTIPISLLPSFLPAPPHPVPSFALSFLLHS